MAMPLSEAVVSLSKPESSPETGLVQNKKATRNSAKKISKNPKLIINLYDVQKLKQLFLSFIVMTRNTPALMHANLIISKNF